MPKRKRPWIQEQNWDEDGRQTKQYVTERKWSAGVQKILDSIYEKTYSYLYEGARKEANNPGTGSLNKADADEDMLAEDSNNLQGAEKQEPNLAPLNMSLRSGTPNQSKYMRQPTLKEFLHVRNVEELSLQEGVMSPNHRSKGTRPNKLWPLTSL
uniref:Uncharacterized protein n=1 Tax=Graphocephala atropunctata TaxID=36148 RepID=A0A1B6MB04_9HEMI